MKYYFPLAVITMLSLSSCGLFVSGLSSALLDNTDDNASVSAYNSLYNASSPKFKDKYREYLESDTELLKSWYHYTVEALEDEYIVKTYYPDTKQITSYYTMNDANLLTYDGICKEWWDDGTKRFEGYYEMGKKAKNWTYYDTKSGAKLKTGTYRKGVKEGKWTYFSIKTQKQIAEFYYANDERNGPFKFFNESGEIAGSGLFFNGKLDSIHWNTSDTAQYAYLLNVDTPLEEADKWAVTEGCQAYETKMAQVECTQKNIVSELSKNLTYPNIAREYNIQGQAIIMFDVDKTGKMVDIKVIRGLCKEIKMECQNNLENLQLKWIPATKDGEKVTVRYYQPIRFKLTD